MQNKVIIGLTGGSGAGKGEAARVFAAFEAEIIDADAVAHRIMRRGESPAFERIVEVFGSGVLGADGEICRKTLGSIVFADSLQLKRLEECSHPVIVDSILTLARKSEKRLIVIDAPLLIPSGLSKICHVVIGVFAPLDMRLARICGRDGISLDAARLRINSQMPDDELRKQVDFAVENDGNLEELHEKVSEIVDIISGRFGV